MKTSIRTSIISSLALAGLLSAGAYDLNRKAL